MLSSTGSSPRQAAPALFPDSYNVRDEPGALPRSSSMPGRICMAGAARRPEPNLPALAARQGNAGWNYSDCHFHPTNYVQQGRSPTTLIADMDQLGIRYATLMPIPTNVLSSQPEPAWKPLSGQHHCGPTYYLPQRLLASRTLNAQDMAEAHQATELYMNTGVDATTALRYQQLGRAEQQRLDPMITGLHIGDMHSSTYLLRKLQEHPGVFTGVGEITVHKEVVEQLFAGNRRVSLEGNIAPLCKLLETCGGIGMPVVLHCDVGQPCADAQEAPAYLEGIRRLFSDPAVTGTTIVWAHAGGLGRFVNAPAGHVDALRSMLSDSRYAHVHIDLSWLVVAERLVAEPEAMARWVELIEAFPKRFLYGSDAMAPVDPEGWNRTYATYQELMQRLSPACRARVCLANYQNVFVAARSKVRAFEKHMLPGIIASMERTCMAATGAATTPRLLQHMQVSLRSPEKQRQ